MTIGTRETKGGRERENSYVKNRKKESNEDEVWQTKDRDRESHR